MMKLKRWHLYMIAILCFILAFTALNFKYDRFYRVNGINNDNRALIEMYLTSDEQDYLIDHAIPVDQFIDYITYDQFHLVNYSYYNSLKQVEKYSDISLLLDDTNQIVDKLSVDFGNQIDNYFQILIRNNLIYDYKNSEDFDFSVVPYYQLLRTLYSEQDYSYIPLANQYLSILEESYSDEDTIYDNFKAMVDTYSASGVQTLMTTPLNEGTQRLYSVELLEDVISSQTFISSYEPKKLTMIQSIPRLSYSMYLQDEAYSQLVNMYKAMQEAIDTGFIVGRAYLSYDILSLGNQNEIAGYSEFQLGTSVSLKKRQISDQDFYTTDVYQWLINNSWQYGYILRYPEGKEDITGHSYDSTTFRYVGSEIATQLYQSQQVLEEYQESQE